MLEPVIDRLSAAFKILSIVALAGAMLITCADVIGRLFGYPVLGAVEVGVLLAAVALAFSMPYTHRERAHVGVEILVMHMGDRGKSALEASTAIVGMVLFAVIGWMCGAYASEMRVNAEVSMTLQIPLYPIIYIISGSFWVLSLVQLLDVINGARKAVAQ